PSGSKAWVGSRKRNQRGSGRPVFRHLPAPSSYWPSRRRSDCSLHRTLSHRKARVSSEVRRRVDREPALRERRVFHPGVPLPSTSLRTGLVWRPEVVLSSSSRPLPLPHHVHEQDADLTRFRRKGLALPGQRRPARLHPRQEVLKLFALRVRQTFASLAIRAVLVQRSEGLVTRDAFLESFTLLADVVVQQLRQHVG